jgi:hypothetical protein
MAASAFPFSKPAIQVSTHLGQPSSREYLLRYRWRHACWPEPGIKYSMTIHRETARSGRIVQRGKCRTSGRWARRGPRAVHFS